MRLKLTVLLLFISTIIYCQEYYYDNCFIRDNLGKFKPLNKSGYFKIENNNIYLFEQILKIQSTRIIFNEDSIAGKMYYCKDGKHLYRFYLTINNELFFYTKENEMIKFTLIVITNEKQ
jgi:hypothetical protein